jgi:hypothetical protein
MKILNINNIFESLSQPLESWLEELPVEEVSFYPWDFSPVDIPVASMSTEGQKKQLSSTSWKGNTKFTPRQSHKVQKRGKTQIELVMTKGAVRARSFRGRRKHQMQKLAADLQTLEKQNDDLRALCLQLREQRHALLQMIIGQSA